MKTNYVLGLDLGIGSIGWGLISNEKGKEKIIDFGVRLFESGEESNGKDRTSQQRRGFRGTRRLIRRKHFRKELIKQHLEYINLTTKEKMQQYFEQNNNNIYELRTKAIDEKISEEELAAILIHICNHRGYKEFYEPTENLEISEDMDREQEEDKMGVEAFKEIYKSKKYRTVGEMFFKDDVFKKSVRNKDSKKDRFLPTRKEVEKETRMILDKQANFYKQLSKVNVERALGIIFSQRDFEDGPGDKNDVYRKYKGFLDSIGTCIFYGEKRAFRGTVISDVYSVVNALSQNTYVDKDSGEILLKPEVANELIYSFLENGNLGKKDVSNICKLHNTEVIFNSTELSKVIKFLKNIRKLLETSGFQWRDFVIEEQFDLERPSRLHQLGEVLSKYQTPKRKRNELSKLEWVNEELIKNAMAIKFSGTANVCYKYMIDAIKAFLNGETYGNFQANKNKELQKTECTIKKYKMPELKDEFITKNPVVFRTINETRKIINAIIDKYGSPTIINIEVASDVNRSYEERRKILKSQNENEKLNEKIKKDITEFYNMNIEDIKPVMIDKYKLYEQQEGKCFYSGAAIIKEQLFDAMYEVDHIVPYSLILDNTLNNKALVLHSENQYKKQRTPLQYMNDEKAKIFIARTNSMLKEKKISDKKYQYLMLPNIYSDDCRKLLDGWKSRNINDTRYITKYIVAYVSNNLKFSGETRINGIKGSYTSRFRKLWLNEETWGSKDRESSNLHHAVDAVVVANLTPAYIEIASDNRKLYQMYKSAGKRETDEYKIYLDSCISKMKKIYGFNEDYSKSLLIKKDRVPSVIPDLRSEVDIRFNDYDRDLFNSQIDYFYKDAEFINSIRMPLVSYKQNKKLQGQITDSNPLNIKKIDGLLYKMNRKNIIDIGKKDLEKIYSDDTDLVDSLFEILTDKSEKYTIADYLKENNLSNFTTKKGTTIYKVTVKDKKVEEPYYKIISENNKTALAANKYYCIEIYKDIMGSTKIRGIRRVDIKVRNKKMFLCVDNPNDYVTHVMYLFKNDYIVVFNNRKNVKRKGFYRSVNNINQNSIYISLDNKTFNGRTDSVTIAKGDSVEKYYVDLLGNIGGEIKCGEPLLLLKEKN
jgi:CRISPR-associated endonuclease Csn1